MRTDKLEAMLASGQDNALLRFSLGSAYLEADPALAARHLRVAVEQDAMYSAAWKLLGKALAANGETSAAIDAYNDGIRVAHERGDKQAAREMEVFRKRLQKQQAQ